jgi:hypothetical protein
LYGGLTDLGIDAKPLRFIPRPALFDTTTQTLMSEASSDFGWRALLYENTNPETDPYPTGIVALEGFLFKRVAYKHQSKTGRIVDAIRAEDEDDLQKYAARVRQLMNRAPIILDMMTSIQQQEQQPQPTTVLNNNLHEDVLLQMNIDDNSEEILDGEGFDIDQLD